MKNTAEPLPRSTSRPYCLLIFAFLIILYTPNRTWAQPCDPWCANSDTFNRTIAPTVPGQNSYWVALRGDTFNPTYIRLYENGSPFLFSTSTPSFLSISGDPSLQYFDQRMVMVVRASNSLIYANTFTDINDGLGARWTGWAADPNRLFGNHSPGIASKIPAGQTGILVVAAKDGNGGTWHIRSTAIANGFAEGWRYLGCCAPPNVPTLACGDPSQLRLGGTGNDGRCYRRVSTDGLNWPPPDQVISPCP